MGGMLNENHCNPGNSREKTVTSTAWECCVCTCVCTCPAAAGSQCVGEPSHPAPQWLESELGGAMGVSPMSRRQSRQVNPRRGEVL